MRKMEQLRILIADDHPTVRLLMRTIVESVPDWRVCGEASNGLAAVQMSGRLRPDVVVMDMMMPDVSGLEATRRILYKNAEDRVVLTTLHDDPFFVNEARRAGACGCFLKLESGRHLIPAVRVAARHSAFFTSDDLELAEVRS